MAKDKDYIRLIHTARWVHLRKEKLNAHPLCERCDELGRVTAATEVHHVVPVENGLTKAEKERLMFDYHNLKALCHDCHVKTHIDMGRSGKGRAKSRAKDQLKRFIDRFIR